MSGHVVLVILAILLAVMAGPAVSEDTGADCAAADAEDGSEVGRRHLQSQGTDDSVQHCASELSSGCYCPGHSTIFRQSAKC
jgi:hypothetical protein